MKHVTSRIKAARRNAAQITVHPRMCPICEASCGLLVEADPVNKTLLAFKEIQPPFSAGSSVAVVEFERRTTHWR